MSILLASSTYTIKFVCVYNIVTGFYQPAKTARHVPVLVDDKLYLWAGRRDDIPDVHRSVEKLKATLFVDIFHCRLGM